jgi:hypothetical protein
MINVVIAPKPTLLSAKPRPGIAGAVAKRAVWIGHDFRSMRAA